MHVTESLESTTTRAFCYLSSFLCSAAGSQLQVLPTFDARRSHLPSSACLAAQCSQTLLPTAMASVESVPAYMLPSVPIAQPSHLEGDASLATEILPGPPPLASVQQTGQPRKDHRKTVTVISYLPTSDPGTTYAGHMAPPLASTAEADGPRRKRARLERG